MKTGEPTPEQNVSAIVVAGGRGTRFGGAKQYEPLGGRRVLDWSLDAARATCEQVILVVAADHLDVAEPIADVVVCGGASRSASVRAGMAELAENTEIVVVHDAARPLAGAHLFRRVIAAVRSGADAAVPGVAVVDTLRFRAPGAAPIHRDDLVAVQTPQAFAVDVLRRVHARNADATDDAGLVDADGGTVSIVAGSPRNRKITEPDDLVVAGALLAHDGTEVR